MFKEIESNINYQLMILLAKEFLTSEDKKNAEKMLSNTDMYELYEISSEHDMDSIIFPEIKKIYTGKIPEIWEKSYIRTRNRIQFMIDKLTEVAEMLNKQGIPIVALKNGGIAIALMDDLAKCPMGDIDTLVKKDDFIKAHKFFVDMGFHFKFRSDFEFEDLNNAFFDGSTEYYYEDRSGSED